MYYITKPVLLWTTVVCSVYFYIKISMIIEHYTFKTYPAMEHCALKTKSVLETCLVLDQCVLLLQNLYGY